VRVAVVDSHTGGEPTRVVVSGGPDLGNGTVAERLARFQKEFDTFRSAVVCEPRGSDVLVGALLGEPSDTTCAASVIFFNNVGYLGMCGHGTIGLVETLAHLGRIAPGDHRIETPVGVVRTWLAEDGRVTVENVRSYRKAKGVRTAVPGHGPVTGDVAWGGNWFFLCGDHGQRLTLDNVTALTEFAWAVRREVNREFPEIDHVELFGTPSGPHADGRNFVLCPGGAYDRSPCGTGTSAKVACLSADGKLAAGQVWRQEGILGSFFEATATPTDDGGGVIPRITGRAYITAEATLILDPDDPYCWGIR
jgi:4-hydroxyproline epimerase